jgi:hypothetical protein
MSAPNDEGNPWLSLADLLRINTTVATLATAIEKAGIQTYDRFGRRIAATNEGPEERVSKSSALNLLALYYKSIATEPRDESFDPDSWYEYDSRLWEFGWPSDEAPDFAMYSGERTPDSLKPKNRDYDAAVSTRPRRTYLKIVAALCKRCGIEYEKRGASQRIREATEELGYPVDDGTIQAIIKEIPEALESR